MNNIERSTPRQDKMKQRKQVTQKYHQSTNNTQICCIYTQQQQQQPVRNGKKTMEKKEKKLSHNMSSASRMCLSVMNAYMICLQLLMTPIYWILWWCSGYLYTFSAFFRFISFSIEIKMSVHYWRWCPVQTIDECQLQKYGLQQRNFFFNLELRHFSLNIQRLFIFFKLIFISTDFDFKKSEKTEALNKHYYFKSIPELVVRQSTLIHLKRAKMHSKFRNSLSQSICRYVAFIVGMLFIQDLSKKMCVFSIISGLFSSTSKFNKYDIWSHINRSTFGAGFLTLLFLTCCLFIITTVWNQKIHIKKLGVIYKRFFLSFSLFPSLSLSLSIEYL